MVINIFSAYFEPLLKDINNSSFLKERKLNHYAVVYKRNIYANLYISCDTNHRDSDLYWPISIKDIMKWFYFLTIMEHTANMMETNKVIIPPLLKAFLMLELRSIGDKEIFDVIGIKCINCLKNGFIFTKFNI